MYQQYLKYENWKRLTKYFYKIVEDNIVKEAEQGPDHEVLLRCDHSIQLLHAHIAGEDEQLMQLRLQL